MTDKKIPMVDLFAQYQSIKNEIDRAINTVIKESSFVGGRFIEQFEIDFANFCGTKHAVALNSGTDALYLSLWALGIKKGDEVITSPFSFFATAEVISRFSAKPVFVDIEPNTFNLNPDQIKKNITSKTKAIIPVHLFGRPANMKKIMKLAIDNSLFVIEDACQAIGAKYKEQKVGSLGDIGCFSFFPSKNLAAYGDGGAVVTNDQNLAESIKKLRNHGSATKYKNESIGVSSRLDGIQAAILLAKLPHLNRWNQSRRQIAKKYTQLLKGFVVTPSEDDNENFSVYHQYTIQIKNGRRDRLKDYLSKNGVSAMVYYPIPLHLMPALKDLGYKPGSFPIAEKASSEVLSLPIYPELSMAKVAQIAQLIKGYVQTS